MKLIITEDQLIELVEKISNVSNKTKNQPYDTNVEFDDAIYITRNKTSVPPLSQGAIDNAVKYEPIKEDINNNIIYTAIFFNDKKLIDKYKPAYPNVFAHHSTIDFKPKDISNLSIGQTVNVKITGRLTTDKVDVLLVDNVLSSNKHPHITLSTNNDVKPYESNSEIINNLDKVKPLNDNISGKVGYFNGKIITESVNNVLLPGELKEQFVNIPLINDEISLELWEDKNKLELMTIVIPKNLRGQGLGNKTMQDVIKYADSVNKPLYLTPDTSLGGSSVSRLVKFYKQFGFEKNKDQAISQYMVRFPKEQNIIKESLSEKTLIGFYQENNIDPDNLSYLGKGDFGIAYSTGDGRVVKTTGSKSEFEIAKQLENNSAPILNAFAKIYKTDIINGQMIIILEELYEDSNIENLYYELEDYLNEQGLPLQYLDNLDIDELDLSDDMIKFMDEIDDINRAYRYLGIEASDIKPDNMGYDKNGRLKAFDIEDKSKNR